MEKQHSDNNSEEEYLEQFIEFLSTFEENMKKKAESDAAFEAFYDATLKTEYLSNFKEGAKHYSASLSRSDKLRLEMESTTKLHRKICNQIAPKLHAYIREHGEPSVYPMAPSGGHLVEYNKDDDSLPFHEQKVGLFFHFCAPQFDFGSKPDYAFDRYMANPEDENEIFLKFTPCKPSFRPRWSDTYDEEFTTLNSRRKHLKDQLKDMNREIESFDLYSGNLITGTIGAIFKFILAFLKTTLKMIVPGIVLGLLTGIIHWNTVNINAILLVLFGLLYLVLLVIQCVKDEVFEFFEDFIMRCKLRIAIPKDRREIPKVERQIKELEENEDYRAAYLRNRKGYEADCRLAEKWQNEWYEQFLHRNNPLLASSEPTASENEK